MNEKRSLVESETDICLTRATLFVVLNASKTQDLVMTETHIGEIPSFLLAKRVVLLVKRLVPRIQTSLNLWD